MRCWNCGSEIAEGEEFCATCGVDIVLRKSASGRQVLCPSCGESFAESLLDPKGFTMECPTCRKERSARQISDEERRQREREKFQNSERAGLRNQRRADRFEVSRCFVRIQRKGLTMLLLRKSRTQMGPLLDLSRTGLKCESEGEFAPGDRVGVSLLVPAFNTPLALEGIIRWATPSGPTRMMIGVEFDTTDERTARHLEALEKHSALRQAADILDQKASSSAAMKALRPGQSDAPGTTEKPSKPADF